MSNVALKLDFAHPQDTRRRCRFLSRQCRIASLNTGFANDQEVV